MTLREYSDSLRRLLNESARRGTPRLGAPGTVGRARDEKARFGVARERLESERARASARGESGNERGGAGPRSRARRKETSGTTRAHETREIESRTNECVELERHGGG